MKPTMQIWDRKLRFDTTTVQPQVFTYEQMQSFQQKEKQTQLKIIIKEKSFY